MSEQNVLSIERIVVAAVQCAEMDEDLTRQMQEGILQVAGKARHLSMVLDLSKVEFLPSVSIGALVSLLTEFKQAGQRFVLAGLQPRIREVLAVARLDEVFEMYDSVDDALGQIRLAKPGSNA